MPAAAAARSSASRAARAAVSARSSAAAMAWSLAASLAALAAEDAWLDASAACAQRGCILGKAAATSEESAVLSQGMEPKAQIP